MKRVIRTAVAEGCRLALLLPLAERRARTGFVILCYHRILPAAARDRYILPDLVVTSESFRRQCRVLRRDYEVLPLHEAVETVWTAPRRPRPVAAITFDDGYRDNYRYAAPILEDTGLKATFFLITDLVGTGQLPWYDRAGRAIVSLRRRNRMTDVVGIIDPFDRRGNAGLSDPNALSLRAALNRAKRIPSGDRARLIEALVAAAGGDGAVAPDETIMTWEELAELTRRGHEIGSHGCTHEILPLLSDAGLCRETLGSRRLLEDRLGTPVRSFCYPNGDVDDRVMQAVRSAGYACAVTVRPGNNGPDQDRYLLKRRFIHEHRLSGLYDTASDLLLRMELCGLADYAFGRNYSSGRRL